MFDPPETDRRLGDINRKGSVCEVDGKRCRVRFAPGLETDWLIMPMARAGAVRIWSQYTEGERVLVSCPDGDHQAAEIICSLASDQFDVPDDPTKIQILVDDGASVVYDPTTHALAIDATPEGSIDLTAGGCAIGMSEHAVTVDATDAGTVSLTAGGCELSMADGVMTLRASQIRMVKA